MFGPSNNGDARKKENLNRSMDNRRKDTIGFALALCLALAALASQPVNAQVGTIYYVDAEATGATNGASWADAFTKLQDALGVVTARIVNSFFSSNYAASEFGYGGGFSGRFDSNSTLINNTFFYNYATHGGGISNGSWAGEIGPPTMTVTNCIVWRNRAGSDNPQIHHYASASLTVSYSDIQGTPVWPGTGNINLDPLPREQNPVYRVFTRWVI